jgi:flagellar protein FliS
VNESHNPYQAYTEGSFFSSPLQMVVALYEGALKATLKATQCLQEGDIVGRGRAINKVNAILSELLISLDVKSGGQIGQNLRDLYLYMQRKLVEAHTQQAAAPLVEVAKLLKTLLEGWQQASETFGRGEPTSGSNAASGSRPGAADDPASRHPTEPVYGGYAGEEHLPHADSGYSF